MKNIIFTLLSGLIILFCLLSCNIEDVVEPSYHISGYVIDSITQQGLDSAIISIGDTLVYYAYTDSTGFFQYGFFGGGEILYLQEKMDIKQN